MAWTAALLSLGAPASARTVRHIKPVKRAIVIRPAAPPLPRGRLTPGLIRKVVRRNLGGVRWCYQDALQRDPSLEGRVVLTFLIDTTGQVRETKTGGDAGLPSSLLACIDGRVASWRFPTVLRGRGAHVRYGVHLSVW